MFYTAIDPRVRYSLKDAMKTSFAGWIGRIIGLSQTHEIHYICVQSTKRLSQREKLTVWRLYLNGSEP